jgi:serine/threonine protein kinase
MKVLNKDRILSQNLIKYVRAERNVLSITNHPFIVKLYFAFQTMNRLFLILEYCPGGDLSKHLFFEKKFCESRAKFYICEVLLALENLHKRNIIFRDLKPDNVVLDEEGHCKLTDFGLSKEGVSDFQSAKSFCGSIAYLAPEMIKKQGHGKSVDWYLLGVLFYEMIVGITPYFSNNKDQIFYNIENAELRIPQFVSKDAANLLKKLLEKNPLKRIGGSDKDAEEIKEDPYFKDINWDDVYNKKNEAPTINNYSSRAIHYFKKPKKFINNDNDNLKSNFLEEWSFVDEAEA